jgi:hypothetical protein
MDTIFDSNIFARILLTIVTAGYAVAPLIADLNSTHATNPLWTPHARFHVVWQVLSYSGFGLIALGLIWIPGPHAAARLYLASGFAAVVLFSFFITFANMRLFGGAHYDPNGYLPKPVSVLGRVVKFDANTTVFSIVTVILLLALISISGAGVQMAGR